MSELAFDYINISILLTERCYQGCKHCLVNSSPEKPLLSKQELKEFAEKVIVFLDFLQKKWKDMFGKEVFVSVDFTGGEVFLYDRSYLVFVCERLYTLSFVKSITVSTNLMYLKSVLEFISGSPFVDICTSYDYGLRFRSEEEEKRWLSNYLKLRDFGCEPEVEVVVTNLLLKNEEKVLSFFEENGIKKVSFSYLFPSGKALNLPSDIFPSLFSVSSFLIKLFNAKDWFKSYTNSYKEFFLRGEGVKFPYGFCFDKFHIKPDGKIYVGEECFDFLLPLKLDAFEDSLWWDSFFKKYFEFFSKIYEVCGNCEFFSICQGGCPYVFNFFKQRGWDYVIDSECTGLKSFLKTVFVP